MADIAKKTWPWGAKVDFHCPYDEATLRVSLQYEGKHICPVCWSMFDAPTEPAAPIQTARQKSIFLRIGLAVRDYLQGEGK